MSENHEDKEILESVATLFYQERIQDGLSKMEEMVTAFFRLVGENEVIVRVLDAIDQSDYVLAADILTYDIPEGEAP